MATNKAAKKAYFTFFGTMLGWATDERGRAAWEGFAHLCIVAEDAIAAFPDAYYALFTKWRDNEVTAWESLSKDMRDRFYRAANAARKVGPEND